MKTFTNQQFIDYVVQHAKQGTIDIEFDKEGQIVLYTGLFFRADDTIADEPDPNYVPVDVVENNDDGDREEFEPIIGSDYDFSTDGT